MGSKVTIDNSIAVSREMVAAHGLSNEEYQSILDALGREPNFTELGIFSAMWNEHCSYKSSKKWLKTLPTSGPQVIQGPGENAGIVDIGDNQCIVFKIESHNHPSYIEPYQGAATGVGGILRDVFTMGARPIASMNSLRFGDPSHPKSKYLLSQVVAGIGGYANSFGVPTLGGELEFDASYNGNILVNAFAAGLAQKDKIFYSKATAPDLPVIYIGAKTGRDGVGGASMASQEFSEASEDKRPNVQIGDPFMGKCLMEACFELMECGAILAIQDMGAAGLSCSSIEMAGKGGLGISLNLDLVPVREAKMTAYEIMLSESQERMLAILQPGYEEVAQKIFHKWGLEAVVIGQTISEPHLKIYHEDKLAADIPILILSESAPEYTRPFQHPERPEIIGCEAIKTHDDYGICLLEMLNSPNQASKRWVFEQYDSFIQGASLIRPGGNSGVVRIMGSKKAVAFSCDVTPRYCAADPCEGAKQAVAECWRNLTSSGAKPLAISDNLNFGNPEKLEIMGQFIAAIEGIAEAAKALEFPIVSGNVSLYNETDGVAIMPTPTIAGVGLITDYDKMLKMDSMQFGDQIFLIGPHGQHLGQSLYQSEILKERKGAPPPVDLALEKQNGDFIRQLIEEQLLSSCHDIASGGLAIALAEMVIKSQKGALITLAQQDCPPANIHACLFGEDQSRYIITLAKENVPLLHNYAKTAKIQLYYLGEVSGQKLAIEPYFTLSLEQLTKSYENWLPNYINS